jgi:hypothetical protein
MILKETISYYVSKRCSVFCTFLDASKAFDRVNYCQHFHLLIKHGLPACIIRALKAIYLCVYWTYDLGFLGWCPDYFTTLNGVKQGRVVSPILLCIYTDDLLVSLSQSDVGYYIAGNFVGAIAFAGDIVLLSSTPFGMSKLLSICDSYALHYGVVFSANKSKYLYSFVQ